MTYQELITAIKAAIKTNGNQEITAQRLQDVLVQMTEAEQERIEAIDIPTLVSELTNDLGYQTATEVANAISAALSGKAEQSAVEQLGEDVAALGTAVGGKAEQADLDTLEGEVSDMQTTLAGKADKSAIPTKVSQLENDSEYQTKADVDAAVADKADKTEIPTVPTKVSALTNDAGYQTASQVQATVDAAVEGKADKSEVDSVERSLSEYKATTNAALAQKADLSAIPAVPTKVSELTNDSKFQTASDVANAVAGKANQSEVNAIQSSLQGISTELAGKASQTDVTKLQTDLGNVNNLSTQQKNVVLAINEVLAAVGAGGTGSVVSLVKTEGGYELYQGSALVGVIEFSSDIADGSIVTTKLADGSVTLVKLSSNVQASLGKADTAVQPSALSEEVAKLESAIAKKADSADIPSVPTKVSDLTNDSGFQTASQVNTAIEQAVSDKASQSEVTQLGKDVDDVKTGLSGKVAQGDFDTLEQAVADKAEKSEIPTKVSELTNDSGYQTASQVQGAVAGKQDAIQDLATIREGASKGASAVQPGSLAEVATSGSYDDLSDKPTIPAEQVNADWNAMSGKAQILNKPTIPAAVTESTVSGWGFTKNTGTYSKPSSGIPKSDLASAVQTSLGKADTAVQPADIANFADKASYTSQSGVTSATIQPNTFTDFGEVASLAITLGSVASDAPLEKRMFGFQFTSGTTATTLTLPDTVKFPEDPTIEAGYTYQITILNNLALIVGWPNA